MLDEIQGLQGVSEGHPTNVAHGQHVAESFRRDVHRTQNRLFVEQRVPRVQSLSHNAIIRKIVKAKVESASGTSSLAAIRATCSSDE